MSAVLSAAVLRAVNKTGSIRATLPPGPLRISQELSANIHATRGAHKSNPTKHKKCTHNTITDPEIGKT